MTVYDFFIKRALDQFFFNAYWGSSFVCVGTPSGVTLSPEGAQHGWKSDIQIANSITWEPAYCIELDWILTESLRRHTLAYAEPEKHKGLLRNRSAVIIRAVTRSLEQKELLKRLKRHARFEGKSESEILESTRQDCLAGAYYVVDHRGNKDYRLGENVVNLFSMGALIPEALKASDELLAQGIYANVIQVSSNDLLLGNLASENNFYHLKNTLGIRGDLFLYKETPKKSSQANGIQAYPPALYAPKPQTRFNDSLVDNLRFQSLGARRVPIVSVHDGEPGLLDNIGSIVGTFHKSLAVRKHSKCGRPSDVYAYHGIDASSVSKACEAALEEAALGQVWVAPELLAETSAMQISEKNN